VSERRDARRCDARRDAARRRRDNARRRWRRMTEPASSRSCRRCCRKAPPYAGKAGPCATSTPSSHRTAARCFPNRGANGIDGVVSSALAPGPCRRAGRRDWRPVLHHDMNALAARQHP
jgi:hypothetical protein